MVEGGGIAFAASTLSATAWRLVHSMAQELYLVHYEVAFLGVHHQAKLMEALKEGPQAPVLERLR